MKLFEPPIFRSADDIYCKRKDEDSVAQAFPRVANNISFALASLERPIKTFHELKKETSTISMSDGFPFQDLPSVCKLQVLSNLKTQEKGMCQRVCREWDVLLKLPGLWRTVDLNFVTTRSLRENVAPLDGVDASPGHLDNKLAAFVDFIESLGVKIKYLTFDLEMCLGRDLMEGFMESGVCSELNAVVITWNDLVPASFKELQQTTCALKQDLNFQRRRQQRQMVVFLKKFVKLIPKIERLTMPFDWSVGSASAVSSLVALKRLKLNKHSELQPLNQSSLDTILNSLLQLEELDLEIFTPSTCGLQEIRIESRSLKSLDASRSKGICFSSLKLPQLRQLRISRATYTCPLDIVINEELTKKPCLLSVLRKGAPRLKFLNSHLMKNHWKDRRCPELEKVLVGSCCCFVHNDNKNRR